MKTFLCVLFAQKVKKICLNAINPIENGLVEYVKKQTEGRLVNVVFEVSGVRTTLDVMNEVTIIIGKL